MMRLVAIASAVVGLGCASAHAEALALRGGESRTHDVALLRGQAVVGDVVQQGIDVVVTVTRRTAPRHSRSTAPTARTGRSRWRSSRPTRVCIGSRCARSTRVRPREPTSCASTPPAGPRRAIASGWRRCGSHTDAFRTRGEALALQGRGQYQRSRALYDRAARGAGRALRLRTRAWATVDYDVAATHQLLGLIDDEVGHYASGERHFARALAVQQAVFGVGHAATLTTQSDLGYLRLAAGDYAGAVAAFTESLARREQLLGRDHPRLLAGLGGLAEAFLKQGDLGRAEATVRGELALREASSQPSPSARTMLGRVLIARGRVAEGEAACAEARSALASRSGSGGTLLASAALCLAAGRLAAGDPEAAAPFAAEALRLREAAGGPDHPWVAEALVAEADVLLKRDRPGDARRALLRAQRIQQRRLGERHPAYVETASRLRALARRPAA